MTKEQYMRVIERVINSPRNDYQKIIMLQQGFELYIAENVPVKENKNVNPALSVNVLKLSTKMGYSG